jgi:hypothetical protein
VNQPAGARVWAAPAPQPAAGTNQAGIYLACQ